MKKTIFLIASIIYSISCLGQQIAVNNAVSIRLPNTMKKLNKDEVSSFANKKFKGDKVALDNAANINPDHAYTVDDVLITLFDGNKSVKNDYLLNLKNGLDEMSKRDKSYTSIIKTINNNQVLIINETWGNVGYYKFFCYNSTKSSALNGTLQFDKSDQDKASKMLNDILTDIKFKN